MIDFYSQNRCVCSTRSHGPLLCAFCLSFHLCVGTTFYVRLSGSTCANKTNRLLALEMLMDVTMLTAILPT